PFEEVVRAQILAPLRMEGSTFLQSEVSPEHATTPHFGAPLVVLPGAYPYHRAHAPSSTLHASVLGMAAWARTALGHGEFQGARILRPATWERMWEEQARTGEEGWNEAIALGWFFGAYRGRRVISHGGSDPGFQAEFILVPDEDTAVVVLGNANTAAVWLTSDAVLDLLFGIEPQAPNVPVTVPVGATLASEGLDAAVGVYHRLQAEQADAFDFSPSPFFQATWGAIEMHRTEAVMPLLQLWVTVQPEVSQAHEMLGWAHLVRGEHDEARSSLQRALELDSENDQAARWLKKLV
ncbi:MAG TPA: serine hydrolase, partial [Ardenticatenaceae bacterium]|nr:serine hydrolase [Ardenticatenaceae bacterium]